MVLPACLENFHLNLVRDMIVAAQKGSSTARVAFLGWRTLPGRTFSGSAGGAHSLSPGLFVEDAKQTGTPLETTGPQSFACHQIRRQNPNHRKSDLDATVTNIIQTAKTRPEGAVGPYYPHHMVCAWALRRSGDRMVPPTDKSTAQPSLAFLAKPRNKMKDRVQHQPPGTAAERFESKTPFAATPAVRACETAN